MTLLRAWASLMLLVAIAFSLSLPVVVYLTYPDVESSESVLEEVVYENAPVKPPRYVVGSLSYGCYGGRDRVVVERARPLDGFIHARIYREGEAHGREIVLVMLPHYIDRREGVVVAREELKELVLGGNATLMVELFKTHRGLVGVVLHVEAGDREYVSPTSHARIQYRR